MTNQLKQLFLLPSLLLANAYLLIGIGDIFPNIDNTSYSERIQNQKESTTETFDTESDSHDVLVDKNLAINRESQNQKTLFQNIAYSILLALSSLSFNHVQHKRQFINNINNKLRQAAKETKIKFQNQLLIFKLTYSFQKSFHCIYYKLTLPTIPC